MRKLLISLFMATLISMPVLAAPLDDARTNGYVAEMPNGYIKAQPGAPADIDKLVKDVNERRKEAYERIAKKNGITVEQVGKLSYAKRMSGK